MARKASSFKVGIFVIVALVVGLGALVYFTASSYLDKGTKYVTFFNESVQGLQRDSVVKYLGVSVGRVLDIRVAPDFNLIEVVMDLRFEGDLAQSMVAQLRSAGITGISFIELTRRQPGDLEQSPAIGFAAEHPIIPSKPSEIAQILGTVERVTRQLGDVDFKGIFEKVNVILGRVERVASDERVDETLEHLRAAAKNLDAISHEAERKVRDFDLKGLSQRANRVLDETVPAVREGKQFVADARLLLADARQAVSVIQREIVAMELKTVSGKADQLLSSLQAQSDSLGSDLKGVSESLRRLTVSMEFLIRRLEMDPSEIIFSTPPPPREAK